MLKINYKEDTRGPGACSLGDWLNACLISTGINPISWKKAKTICQRPQRRSKKMILVPGKRKTLTTAARSQPPLQGGIQSGAGELNDSARSLWVKSGLHHLKLTMDEPNKWCRLACDKIAWGVPSLQAQRGWGLFFFFFNHWILFDFREYLSNSQTVQALIEKS